MSFREIYRDCDCREGSVVIDVQPMTHLDKWKHLNDKGELTASLDGCAHPNKINDYCSSACPLMEKEDIQPYKKYKQNRLNRELKKGKAPMLEAREKAAEKIYRGVEVWEEV